MSTLTPSRSPADEAPAPWPRIDALADVDASDAITSYREALAAGNAWLDARFRADENVEVLVSDRARLIDALVVSAWQRSAEAGNDPLTLVAVGGYGRGELHPGSDIDVMVLLPDANRDQYAGRLEQFLTFLWDIGLEVGHSSRTLDDCVKESRDDVTVVTTLMEARLLAGPPALFDAMCEAVSADALWAAPEFFTAKVAEQTARHHRYHDTAYNLEPNVKGSPGGLRDIQMIGWVTNRRFGTATLEELVDQGFLTYVEYDFLCQGRRFLWKIRYALHMITGRREDRLLFDHQARLAEMLGYVDATGSLAVEQLMQQYYRTVIRLSRLNEMLLQLLREAILMNPHAPAQPLNERFLVRNGFLEAVDDEVFERAPSSLLEVFLLLQQNPQLAGVSAATVRLIRENRHRIDDAYRADPEHARLFMAIIQAPAGVTHELRRMHLYGVLGRYIPAFGSIVGRMQYDLFHAYTVDAHTLFVVSNLRRFALPRFDHEFPLCSRLMQSLPKPELSYLSGLFHDIGKGRGGDHSVLGADDAMAFCRLHGLSDDDAELVTWLVRHHLTLSVTAQKKDISDPQVVHDFATLVQTRERLDYLYVLTVADVRGTNPNLWNSWKASLFEEFHRLVSEHLERGLAQPAATEELIDTTRRDAGRLLEHGGLDASKVDALWRRFTDDYLLRYDAEEIAFHIRVLCERDPADTAPLVAVEPGDSRGGTAVFIYSPASERSFAGVTGVLDELGLTIVDARITNTTDGYSLDTYRVIEATGKALSDGTRMAAIQRAVERVLKSGGSKTVAVTRRAPRRLRMFTTPTRLAFSADERAGDTVLELVTGDRPGMLSDVGRVFDETGVKVRAARITTVGERAEDVFHIATSSDEPLDQDLRDTLRKRLIDRLDDNQ
ncbi:MAG: [protein-PII] uridylyltransferase [Pseudomonadota bacterium]